MKDFKTMFSLVYGNDFKKASSELGISERQIFRYLSANKATKPVQNLLNIIYRGYLPDTGPWSECRINRDGCLSSPWGTFRASDIQFVHRYKWAARQNEKRYIDLKKKYSEHSSDMSRIEDRLLELLGEINMKKAL